MSFCPKCQENQKPDNLKNCMPCAKKRGKLLARIGAFLILAIGLFVTIYLKTTGAIPQEGLIKWLINDHHNPLSSSYEWLITIMLAIIALVSGVLIYFITLKNNKK